MYKFIARLLIIVAVMATLALATDMADTALTETETEQKEEGRIRRIHRHRFPFYASLFGLGGLGGLGGLNALAVLFAIKIKLLVVAAIVGLSVFYWMKHSGYSSGYSFGGESIIPYEAYSPHATIGYSSPSFIGAAEPHHHHHHGGAAVEYSSYPGGPDPYSAYGAYGADSSQPDLSSLSQHAPGFETISGPYGYGGPSSNDRSSSSSPSYSSYSYDGSSSAASSSKLTSHKKSSRRTRRQAVEPIDAMSLLSSINWGEIAFQFLGVDSVGCRKRFVCEFDFRAARNPFTRMAYTLIGKSFFDKYRDLRADAKQAAKFTDCARMYRECAAAEEYNDVDDAELHSVEPVTAQPTTTDDDADPMENDVIEFDQQKEKVDDSGLEQHDVGRMILLRAEQ